jgi:adenylate kinase family enzyme
VSPQRVLLHGCTGSGKSTAAVRIGAALDLPVHLVDEVMWQPGWVTLPEDQQHEWARRTCADDAWVLDSSYSSWTQIPKARCDLVVGLDYPRWLSFGRLVRRTFRRIRSGELVCNGNVETWRSVIGRDSILWWHVKSFGRKRRRMWVWATDPAGPAVLLFRRPAELEDWIAGLSTS